MKNSINIFEQQKKDSPVLKEMITLHPDINIHHDFIGSKANGT